MVVVIVAHDCFIAIRVVVIVVLFRLAADVAFVVVVLAGAGIDLVAVECVAVQAAVICVGLDGDVFGDPGLAAGRDQDVAILRPVRIGEDRLGPDVVELDRRQAIADQVGRGPGQVYAHGAVFAVGAAGGEEAVELRRRGVAPAVLAVVLVGGEQVEVAAVHARARGCAQAAERAARLRQFRPLEGGSVVREQYERAAQRVKAERRVGVAELDAANRHFRKQVGLHHIAERVVDAHAVLKRGDADALAQQRAGDEAAVVEVALIRVVLQIDRGGAGERALDEIVERETALGLERARLRRLHVVRNLVDGQARAGERGNADHVDIGQFGRPGIGLLRARLVRGQRAERARGREPHP